MMNETLTLTLPADAVETLMRVLAESIEQRDARIRVLEKMRDSGPEKGDNPWQNFTEGLSKVTFPDPFK